MRLSKNYVENVYLMEEFTPEKATVERFHLSRALQNSYGGDRYGRDPAYRFYKLESTKLLTLFKLERINFSELISSLVRLRLETIVKFPECFRKDTIGWYDLRRAKEKDEKQAWLALPIDSKLVRLAKKEGRISCIVRK